MLHTDLFFLFEPFLCLRTILTYLNWFFFQENVPCTVKLEPAVDETFGAEKTKQSWPVQCY